MQERLWVIVRAVLGGSLSAFGLALMFERHPIDWAFPISLTGAGLLLLGFFPVGAVKRQIVRKGNWPYDSGIALLLAGLSVLTIGAKVFGGSVVLLLAGLVLLCTGAVVLWLAFRGRL